MEQRYDDIHENGYNRARKVYQSEQDKLVILETVNSSKLDTINQILRDGKPFK